jgi:hypothetical protein
LSVIEAAGEVAASVVGQRDGDGSALPRLSEVLCWGAGQVLGAQHDELARTAAQLEQIVQTFRLTA